MNHKLVRPVALLALVALPACADPPAPPGQEALAEMETGWTRADVMDRLPEGDLAEDDAPRVLEGYALERYFTDGANVEVVWLHRPGSGGEVTDARTDLNPVVFREGLLDGWGWEHFDRRAEEWGLRSPEPATEPEPPSA